MTIHYEKNMNGCINEESPVRAGLLRLLPRDELDRPTNICLHNSIWSNRKQAFISVKLTFSEVNRV